MKSSIFGGAAISEGRGRRSSWLDPSLTILLLSQTQICTSACLRPFLTAPSGFTSPTSTSGSALPSQPHQTFPAGREQKLRRWLFKLYWPQWTHRQLGGEPRTTFEAGFCAETKGSFGGVSPANPTNQAAGCREWAWFRRRNPPSIWPVSFNIKTIKRLFLQQM